MEEKKKDSLARSAANVWCFCHKCDGIVNETGMRCDKERMHTCRKWYDGYRTALIALDKSEEAGVFSGDDRAVFHELLDEYLDLPEEEKAKGARFVQKCDARIEYRDGDSLPVVVTKKHNLFIGANVELELTRYNL